MDNTSNIDKLIEQHPDLQFLPLMLNKRPLDGIRTLGWPTKKKRYTNFTDADCEGVGLVCGKVSGGIEVIDIDIKYDITGTLWEDYYDFVNEHNKQLLGKVVVQKTVNKGFHLIYRCETIEGNQELAKRLPTEEEKRINPLEKHKTLIETRGEGGQICCNPTRGYEFQSGSLSNIATISPEERNLLINAAKYFNEIIPEAKEEEVRKIPNSGTTGIKPWEDYNNKGDVVSLLQKHGWTVVKTRGAKTHLLRPGNPTSESSGNYNSTLNWFSVFTPNASFDQRKAYRPFSVYAMLECQGDIKEAAKRLSDEGYGEKTPLLELRGGSVVEKPKDIIVFKPYSYEEWRKDISTTPNGLKCGISNLNPLVRIPQGAITLIAGRPSHGKTTFMMNMMLKMAEIYDDKKFYFFSYEEQSKYILIKLLNILIQERDLTLDTVFEPAFIDAKTNQDILKIYLRMNRNIKAQGFELADDKLQVIKRLLNDGTINIVDVPYKVEELAEITNELHAKEPVGAFFIDYIQKIGTSKKTQDKRTEIAHISNHILQNIAKSTGLPTILGAQFNREADGKNKPKLSELKEAGNLEEDANLVLGIFNCSVSNDAEDGSWPRDVPFDVTTLKNRDGKVNETITLKFDRVTGFIR